MYETAVYAIVRNALLTITFIHKNKKGLKMFSRSKLPSLSGMSSKAKFAAKVVVATLFLAWMGFDGTRATFTVEVITTINRVIHFVCFETVSGPSCSWWDPNTVTSLFTVFKYLGFAISAGSLVGNRVRMFLIERVDSYKS